MLKNVEIFGTAAELIEAARALIVSTVVQAAAERGQSAVAWAGGNTPRAVYQALAKENSRALVPWHKLHSFWGDERMVPPDHELSNFRMTREALLDHVEVPAGNIHRIQGELPPEEAAQQYRAELQRYFENQEPIFDLILLGLGDDGHTASLFPGTPAVFETTQTATAVFAPPVSQWRVTLTLPVINRARQVVFLVAGKAKAEIIAALSRLNQPEARWPASLVQPRPGELLWLLDAEAASLLPQRT